MSKAKLREAVYSRAMYIINCELMKVPLAGDYALESRRRVPGHFE